MRIGYCSPFNPLKSGISDFSEELVAVLSDYVQVVVFSPVKPENSIVMNCCEVHNIKELDNADLRNSLDIIVYHIGNNYPVHKDIVDMMKKYPGVLELHDVGLHNMVAEKYYVGNLLDEYVKLAEYCHGKRGLHIAESFLRGEIGAPWEEHPEDMTMNRSIIECATAVVVHSEKAKQMVLAVRDDKPVICIMLHTQIDSDLQTTVKNCRQELHLPQDKLIFGSFGFATQTKRIFPILDALQRLIKKREDFLYLIVGKTQQNWDMEHELRVRGLQDHVIVTGFTSLEDFKTYMGACDFCLNLRYPTQGESSASLHRMLGMGKPAIVTDVGTFSDYPDDVVIKVRYDAHEIDDICMAIRLLSNNRKELVRRSEAAVRFAKENCDIRKNAQRYAMFFEQVSTNTWQPDYEDVMIGRLCDLGITSNSYLKHIWGIL